MLTGEDPELLGGDISRLSSQAPRPKNILDLLRLVAQLLLRNRPEPVVLIWRKEIVSNLGIEELSPNRYVESPELNNQRLQIMPDLLHFPVRKNRSKNLDHLRYGCPIRKRKWEKYRTPWSPGNRHAPPVCTNWRTRCHQAGHSDTPDLFQGLFKRF